MRANPLGPRRSRQRGPSSTELREARGVALALGVVLLGLLAVEFGLIVGVGGASPLIAQAGPGDASRGEYLAQVFACQDCHSLRAPDGVHLAPDTIMAGGNQYAGPWGTFTSANITEVAPTLDDATLEALIRGQQGFLGPMPTGAYNAMATQDMRDLIAYLRTLPPVDQPLPADVPDPSFTPPPPSPVISVPSTAPSGPTLDRGNYLVQQAACADCHTPRAADGSADVTRQLAGGGQQFPQPDGSVLVSPNLTPAGPLGAWTDDQIAAAIRQGQTPDGQQLNAVMPYASAYDAYTDVDVSAVIVYLRSLPPVAN